jgi:hypothetical protein
VIACAEGARDDTDQQAVNWTPTAAHSTMRPLAARMTRLNRRRRMDKTTGERALNKTALNKTAGRLLPFLCMLYFINYTPLTPEPENPWVR